MDPGRQPRCIKWEEIEIWPDNEDIIGTGGYSSVLKATWADGGTSKVVAIKFLSLRGTSIQEVESKARHEASIMIDAKAAMTCGRNLDNDLSCEVYGVASGKLTEKQGWSRNWPGDPGDLCVGIVMRYEPGCSLKNRMQNSPKPSVMTRIRISASIATGNNKK